MTQIYFAQAHVSKSNKPIKIGLSHDVAGRIYDMQVGCPVQLTLLASFEGLARHERLLHKKFYKHNIRGEWFKSSNEILKIIDEINSGRFNPDDICMKEGMPELHPKQMKKDELNHLLSHHTKSDVCLHYDIKKSDLNDLIENYGLKKPNKPKNVSNETVQQIRYLYEGGTTQYTLAEKFDLAQSTICKIVNNYIHKKSSRISGEAEVKVGYNHGN